MHSRACDFASCALIRKAHVLAHCVLALETVPSDNLWNACTWRDEDMIGKVMGVVHAVHQRAIGTKVIEFCSVRAELEITKWLAVK